MKDSRQTDGRQPGSNEERGWIPLPRKVVVDTDAELAADRQLRHWLDEAFEACRTAGGFDNLSGTGKPLQVPTGDPLAALLKNANAAPPWVTLRKDVRDRIAKLNRLLLQQPDHPDIDGLFTEINDKIDTLNVQAPSLSLQRRRITRDNIAEQLEKWL
ncbi:DUF1992 domain-containing protein [Paenibacillus athensensis]|uniref:DnaJ family domain-containing protein n=1 Tax=Paenibacillus athensensis TaxID=1967502 RepID=UPI001430349E|nr:DnaJ family domain-containing protein [Paenibacillus athensensis]MCD1258672.1 DUF1992 domain-containing protein [Paenibacillus athensensis]